MSHMWVSHVSHMSEACLTYEWVMSHIWVSHVSHMSESCPTYERVMGHVYIPAICASHGTRKRNPAHPKWWWKMCVWERVLSHTHTHTHTHTLAERESHHACGESCLTYARDLALFLMGIIALRRVCSTGSRYGVATVSRIDTRIGLFCKRDL